jgi:hypothetical protein
MKVACDIRCKTCKAGNNSECETCGDNKVGPNCDCPEGNLFDLSSLFIAFLNRILWKRQERVFTLWQKMQNL